MPKPGTVTGGATLGQASTQNAGGYLVALGGATLACESVLLAGGYLATFGGATLGQGSVLLADGAAGPPVVVVEGGVALAQESALTAEGYMLALAGAVLAQESLLAADGTVSAGSVLPLPEAPTNIYLLINPAGSASANVTEARAWAKNDSPQPRDRGHWRPSLDGTMAILHGTFDPDAFSFWRSQGWATEMSWAEVTAYLAANRAAWEGV